MPVDLQVGGDTGPGGSGSAGDGTTSPSTLIGEELSIPTEILTLVSHPENIEGFSLQRFMNEFPPYSRASRDSASVIAQILTPMSVEFDQLILDQTTYFNSLYLKSYPTYGKGFVYEFDFSGETDLTSNPGVSGLIATSWLNVPITTDPIWFWDAPPTRLPVTDTEVTSLTLLPKTTITSGQGYNNVMSTSVTPPLYKKLWVHISGADTFRYTLTEDIAAQTAYIDIWGHAANESLRPDSRLHHERLFVSHNGQYKTSTPWSLIKKIDAFGLPSGTTISAEWFDFNSTHIFDDIMQIPLTAAK